MKATPNLDFTKVRPTEPSLKSFVAMLRKIYLNLTTVINGNLGFGDGSVIDNISGSWINVNAPAAPNTDFTVTHNLNRLPVGYLVMEKDRACDVYTGSVAATKTQLTLRASTASAVLRLFVVSLLLSFVGLGLQAQTTNLTIQVTDSGAQSWNNGTWQATLVTPPGIFPYGPPFFLFGTQTPVPNQNQSGSLSGTGSATITMTQNAGILPSQSQWKLIVCSATSAKNNCFTVFTTVTAVTTLNITPPALLVDASFVSTAYSDAEVNASRGSIYYNLTTGSTRQCQLSTGSFCTVWSDLGGAGGGALLQTNGVTNTVQTLLNLISGPGIGLASDGSGGVTITNTAPLQTTVGPRGTIQSAGVGGAAQASNCIEPPSSPNTMNCTDTVNVKGPNPEVSALIFGARPVPINNGAPFNGPGVTASCTNGSTNINLSGAGLSNFVNGDGFVAYNCGPAHSMTTPAAPTVTPAINLASTNTGLVATNGSAGSTNNRCYVIVARDQNQGITAKSAEACISGGSAVLGSNPVSITSCSRSLQTVTCITSPHTGPIGCTFGNCGTVMIFGTSDAINFNGTFPISSFPDNTHFTYVGGLSSANNATTSSTGGTFKYFNSDHLVLPAFGTGMTQYGIYEGASGAETLVDVSLVNVPALVGSASYNTWDWLGTTYSGGAVLPAFWPSTPPSSPTNDSLITTIVSGGGTSSIVVASSASNTTTGTALFDNCPTVQAANNFANSFSGGGGVTTLDPVPAAAGSLSYVFNSYCTLTGAISQSMQINLLDTMQFSGKWTAQKNPNVLYESFPAFGIETLSLINVTAAKPGIYFKGGSMRGVALVPRMPNNYLLMFYNSVQRSIFENMSFGSNQATDFSGISFYDFETQLPNAFGWTMNNVVFDSGPSQVFGDSFTPAVIVKNNYQMRLNNTPMCCRGFLFVPFAAGMDMSVDMQGEIQGATEPVYGFYFQGGGVGGWADFANVWLDTAAAPGFANYGTGVGIHLSIKGANGPSGGFPLISGAPFSSVDLTDIAVANHNQIGQNVNSRLNGEASSGTQWYDSNVLLSASNNLFTNTLVPAAPTCNVISATPPTPGFASGTWQYIPIYFGGGLGTPSAPSNSCTADGVTQQASLVIPSSVPGAVSYSIWKTGVQFSVFGVGCTSVPGLTISIGSQCGSANFPKVSSGGPAGIGGLNLWGYNLTLSNFQDVQEIPPPANPAAGFERWFANNSTHQLSCLMSSGASCASSGSTPSPPNLSVQIDNSGVLGGIPVPTSPNGVPQSLTSTPSGGVGVVGAFHLSGVVPRVTTCPSNLDTVLATDRAGLVEWNDASPCAVTLPQAGSGGGTNNDFTNNFVFLSCNIGAGTATITPTTSTITSVINGVVTSGRANLPLSPGQCSFFYSDNANYTALVIASSGVNQLQTNTVNNSSQVLLNLINSAVTNGLTLTVTNTSGGIVQLGLSGTLNNSGLTNPSTTVNGQTCTLGSTCTLPPGTITVANAGVTGTTVNTLTKLVGAPSTAVIAATTDTSGVVGITTSGAGTAGNAVIQLLGLVSCVFDGATIAGDYVQISSTVVGNCHDIGSASYPIPGTGMVIGRVLSTNGAGGTFTLDLFPAEININRNVSSLGSGAGTAGFLACVTASNTMGNCTGTPPVTFLGVFLPGGVTYANSGIATVTIDATQNVTFGDILCASSIASKAHDNGSVACANGQWVGQVTTTATSVSSVTANLRLQ